MVRSSIPNKHAILVLGPHRSGTSLITSALYSSGFNPGGDLLTANEENPRGFFESKSVVAFNDELLAKLDLSWDCIGVFGMGERARSLYEHSMLQRKAKDILHEVFLDHPRIALKDPRLCILEPFWTRVLKSQGYVVDHILVIRHPLESALSQAARYRAEKSVHVIGATLGEGVHLWASYMLEALTNLRGSGPCFVDYTQVMAVPEKEILRMRVMLGIHERDQDGVNGIVVDPSLKRHHASDISASSKADFHNYVAVYESLSRVAARKCRANFLYIAYLCARLKAAMSGDHTLEINQRRIYVRAREQAIGRGMQLIGSQEELVRAGNIIRFNEYIIAELKKKLTTLGDGSIGHDGSDNDMA